MCYSHLYLYPTDIVISLKQSEYLVANEDSSLLVVITMSNVTSQDVIVQVTVSDGSASGKTHIRKIHVNYKINCVDAAGRNYIISPAIFNITIPAGSLSSSFSIDIVNDPSPKEYATFNIAVRLLPSNLSLSIDNSSSVVIIHNEG